MERSSSAQNAPPRRTSTGRKLTDGGNQMTSKPANGEREANKKMDHDAGAHIHSSYGKPLTVEETYTFEHPAWDKSGEPHAAIEHNPFYMAPGMAAGYSKGLYGKGFVKQPPKRVDAETADHQWGDPHDEEDWYCG